MDKPIRDEEHTGEDGSSAAPDSAHDGRRDFLKTGLRGALLLPYVAPAIDTVFLSDAWGSGNDDDNSGGNDNSGGTQPSPIANVPPPPPTNTNSSSNS